MSIVYTPCSETCAMEKGLVNHTRLDDDLDTIVTTQGRLMCSLDEVKIIDEEGNEVAPNVMMDEKNCAFIVPKVPSHGMKSTTLRKYLRSFGVADYKVPDRFEFIDSLPLTPIGKPDQVVLREVIRQRLQQDKKL